MRQLGGAPRQATLTWDSDVGIVKAVADQFAHPHGPAARLMGPLLNMVNRGVNRAAIDAAELRPGERVLDIGFGGGIALRDALDRVGDTGLVVGVELSEEMLSRARRAFDLRVAAGRLELLGGGVDAIPVGDNRFDAVYTVNTVYFWPDISLGLREILRVLAPGGRFVLAVQHRAMRQNRRFGGYETPPVEQFQDLMAAADFTPLDRREPGHDAVLLVGRKPQ